jgi:hypothetical protein
VATVAVFIRRVYMGGFAPKGIYALTCIALLLVGILTRNVWFLGAAVAASVLFLAFAIILTIDSRNKPRTEIDWE